VQPMAILKQHKLVLVKVDPSVDGAQQSSRSLYRLYKVRLFSSFFCGLPGGADSHRLATHSNQASPTAGGPRQSLTSKIRLKPLSQEVPSAQCPSLHS
jgi:hypothetical protein